MLKTCVTMIGGPTSLIEWAGLRLLTDPTFSSPGAHESAPGRVLTKLEPPALTVDAILPIDIVLLSHDQHADNLDPAGREVLGLVPVTLTTPEATSRLGGAAHPLNVWEEFQLRSSIGGVTTITAVPARHGPPGCESLTGSVTGFVLQSADFPTIYISGDNASLDVVTEIAQRFDIDIAVIFAGAARTSLFDGAPLTLASADAAKAAVSLKSSHVIPLHVRGWAHFSEGPETIDLAFNDAGISDLLINLSPGQKVAFSYSGGITGRLAKED